MILGLVFPYHKLSNVSAGLHPLHGSSDNPGGLHVVHCHGSVAPFTTTVSTFEVSL